MKFEMTKVKTFTGREGVGFNAVLLADGKKVADVSDMANGGCYDWYWVERNSAASVEFTKQAKAAFPEDKFEVEDSLASRLVDIFTMMQTLKRRIKKGYTLYVLPKHKQGAYIQTAEKVEDIQKKVPNATILNLIIEDSTAIAKALKFPS